MKKYLSKAQKLNKLVFQTTYHFVVLLGVLDFYANIFIPNLFLTILILDQYAYFFGLLLEINHVLEGFERQELSFFFGLKSYHCAKILTIKRLAEFIIDSDSVTITYRVL